MSAASSGSEAIPEKTGPMKMNYQRVYEQIIERARRRKLRGYYETHHVVPRALAARMTRRTR